MQILDPNDEFGKKMDTVRKFQPKADKIPIKIDKDQHTSLWARPGAGLSCLRCFCVLLSMLIGILSMLGMDFHGICVDFIGVSTISVDFHGFAWICLEIFSNFKIFSWISVDVSGFARISLDFPWIFCEFLGFPWIFMDFHGFSGIFMDFHRFSWIWRCFGPGGG